MEIRTDIDGVHCIHGNIGILLGHIIPETVTECNPMGTEENRNGVTSPVSFPSRVIVAPGGSLATRKNPLGYSSSMKLTLVVDSGTGVYNRLILLSCGM